MVHVYADFPKEVTKRPIIDQIWYDDNSLIKVTDMEVERTEDYGDEDCTKMVSIMRRCKIHIDKSIADDFKDVTYISTVRYNYYMPCYDMWDKTETKTVNPDGSITFTVA